MPSLAALESAAAAAAPAVDAVVMRPIQLSFQGLLDAKLYRAAVAWGSKSSGKHPRDEVVSYWGAV